MTVRSSFLPAAVAPAEWGALFQDVTRWQPAVLAVCDAHGLGPVTAVQAGFPGTCAVFIVDRRQVVKFFPPFLARDWARERAVYRALAGRPGPPRPALLAAGRLADRVDWPYLVLGFLPGRPIRELRQHLSPADRARLGAALGGWLQALHAVGSADLPDWPESRPAGLAWRHFLEQRRTASLAELAERLPLSRLAAAGLSRLLDEAVSEAVTTPPALSLLHADLTEDHLLLQEATGSWQVTGLIDWADAELGQPAYEWVALWFGLCARDRPFFTAILQAYDPALRLNRAFARRQLAFTCLHRFGPEMIAVELERAGGLSALGSDELDPWLARLWPGGPAL